MLKRVDTVEAVKWYSMLVAQVVVMFIPLTYFGAQFALWISEK